MSSQRRSKSVSARAARRSARSARFSNATRRSLIDASTLICSSTTPTRVSPTACAASAASSRSRASTSSALGPATPSATMAAWPSWISSTTLSRMWAISSPQPLTCSLMRPSNARSSVHTVFMSRARRSQDRSHLPTRPSTSLETVISSSRKHSKFCVAP